MSVLYDVSGLRMVMVIHVHREHSHLVVSTLRETLVFAFGEKDSITHLDPSIASFSTHVPTLAVRNILRRQLSTNFGRTVSTYVDSSLVVQITPEGAQLMEYDHTLGQFSKTGQGWYPKTAGADYSRREVVAAAMNASQIILGLSGGVLAILNLAQNDTLHLVTSHTFPNEVCAISCQPLDPAKSYASSMAVSFWGSNEVLILALDTPNPFHQIANAPRVTLPSLPRSILLHNFGTSGQTTHPEFRPHLLIGLADGTLITYAFRDKGLHDRKQSSLGNAPVSLSVCQSEERTVVLASGSRANLLFWDNQRIKPSPVSIKVGLQLSASLW